MPIRDYISVAFLSVIVVLSSVLQFHHHSEDGFVCFRNDSHHYEASACLGLPGHDCQHSESDGDEACELRVVAAKIADQRLAVAPIVFILFHHLIIEPAATEAEQVFFNNAVATPSRGFLCDNSLRAPPQAKQIS